MSDIPSAEELILLEKQEQESPFKLAVVVALFSNNTAKITFDGEEEASEKQYSYLDSYVPGIGDRVILASVSGTYVILGKVKFNEAPTPTTNPNPTFNSLKVNGNATINGELTANNPGRTAKFYHLDVTGYATFRSGVQFQNNIGFFGYTPSARKTAYYANSDSVSVVRQRLNELIQRLGEYGLISPSN